MSNETGGEREDIHAVLLRHWGFREFRPMQEQIIRQALAGKDTLALLPTGGESATADRFALGRRRRAEGHSCRQRCLF